MTVVSPPRLEPLLDDPDDYRPRSRLGLVVDAGGPEGRVDSFCLIFEEIAPGDRVPLHRHPVDEVILVLSGTDRSRSERRKPKPAPARRSSSRRALRTR